MSVSESPNFVLLLACMAIHRQVLFRTGKIVPGTVYVTGENLIVFPGTKLLQLVHVIRASYNGAAVHQGSRGAFTSMS